MIDFSSFYQKPGESWADMMEEEDEEEEEENKKIDESRSDSNAPNNNNTANANTEKNGNKQDHDETTNEINQGKEKDNINDKENANVNNKVVIKKTDENPTVTTTSATTEVKKQESATKTKSSNSSGIVWRLPSAEQKKQQQEFIQRLVEQRQNIDKLDSWRRKPAKEESDRTESLSWRTNRPYRAPEKNNSQQWHTYSEVLQQEYEEQEEENRKEFKRRFGSKTADKENVAPSSSLSLPTPEPSIEPTKTSILISADGPSDWADDIPASEEEEEEGEATKEEMVENEFADRSASESLPSHDEATLSSASQLGPVQLGELPHERVKLDDISIVKVAQATEVFSSEQNDNRTQPPALTKQEESASPSAWTAFAEQNSPKASSTTSTPTVVPTIASAASDAQPEDEQLKTESFEEIRANEDEEQPKDEIREAQPKIAVQEDRTSSWNAFAEQSAPKWTAATAINESLTASKWSSETINETSNASVASNESTAASKWATLSVNEPLTVSDRSPKMSNQSSIASKWAPSIIDDASSEHSWHSNTSGQHHQHNLNPENPDIHQSQSYHTIVNSTTKPKDTVKRSPRMQILNHLSKNSNNIRQQSPPSTTHSSPSLASTVSETNHTAAAATSGFPVPQQNSPVIADNTQGWKNFAKQHSDLKSNTLSNPTIDGNEDDTKSQSSYQNNTMAIITESADDSWKTAGATWNSNPVTLETNEDATSHHSWKSDSKSITASTLRPPAMDGRASAAWMAVSAKNDDDDVHSHTSRRSDNKPLKVAMMKDDLNSSKGTTETLTYRDNAEPWTREVIKDVSVLKEAPIIKLSENEDWTGGASWNNMTMTTTTVQYDGRNDDNKSYTSRRSDAKSSQRGNNNERASAAWIAAGIQVKGTQSDSTRRNGGVHQEREHSLGGAASSWTTTVTVEELMGSIESERNNAQVESMKNYGEQASNTWNTNSMTQNRSDSGLNNAIHGNPGVSVSVSQDTTKTDFVEPQTIPNNTIAIHSNGNKIKSSEIGDDSWRDSATWVTSESASNDNGWAAKSDIAIENNTSAPISNRSTDTNPDIVSSGASNKWQAYAKQHANNKYGGDGPGERSPQRNVGMNRRAWVEN